MSYASRNRFSLSAFAVACLLAIAVNGSVLVGFNHLAESSDAVNPSSQSQLAAAPARQVTL